MIGDLPLARYFERIQMVSSSFDTVSSTPGDNKANVQTINKQYLIDLFKYITNNLLPKSVFKEWATYTYSDATDYFHFRKLFTSQIAIYGLLEYSCFLTRLNPDQFYLSQNTGMCQTMRLKFDLKDQNSNSVNLAANSNSQSSNLAYYKQIIDFDSSRSVPLRLTPNIVEFLTNAGINGVYNTIQIAQARCLVQSQYHFIWILRAILKDEILICISRKVSILYYFSYYHSSLLFKNLLIIFIWLMAKILIYSFH